MKTLSESQCELDGHEIEISIMDTSVPYLGIRCECKTCDNQWLENYQRCFVSKATKVVPIKPESQLELPQIGTP